MDDGGQLLARGLSLLQQERFVEAEAALHEALAQRTSVMGMFALAGAQWSQNDFAACEATYERLLTLGPLSGFIEETAYLRISKLRGLRGDSVGAREILLQAAARSPHNIRFIIGYADLIGADDPARAFAELEHVLATPGLDPPRRSVLLKLMTHHRENELRRTAGLPPGVAISWEDACGWQDRPGLTKLYRALQQECSGVSARLGAVLDLGCVAITAGDWNEAERCFTTVRKRHPGTYADMITLAPALSKELEGLPDDALFGDLPPIIDLVTHAPDGPPTLFLASDETYFRTFTKPFLRTLDRHKAACDVHIHLLDGDPETWRREIADLGPLTSRRVSLSAEASGAKAQGAAFARTYYHAIRFIRLYEEMKRRPRPLWLLDVDVELRRDPAHMLAKLANYDIALKGRACAFEPGSKLSACCVGIAPTTAGIAFARLTAGFIAQARRDKLWDWGIDQAALFLAYVNLVRDGRAPRAWFLQNDAVSLTDDTAVFRFTSGIAKHMAPRDADAQL